MTLLQEIFSPDFLLRNSVYVSLLVGAVCPLAGSYLVMRRMVFLGLALPQVSSCGIALAFALHTWGIIPHLEEGERGLAFAGSTVLTLFTIVAMTFLERRGKGLADGRIGTAYALAGAWSILLLVKNPYGEHGLLERMKGEIISVSNFDLALTAGTFGLVALLLLVFRKEILLVSFDREMAVVLRKNLLVWDGLFFVAIGLAVSLAVLSTGPLVTFGFLVIPPLTAHHLASNMRQYTVLSSVIGITAALGGFCLAYRLDLPVGPTDVALLGIMYAASFLYSKLTGRTSAA
jgi:ABC-type Mn2+/Zn2+ transport system permease subunit